MRRGDLRRALALVRHRTHRNAPLPVILYERPGCHLCEETHRALRRIALDRPLDITRIDITGDSALERAYVLRIPVLAASGRELDSAGFDDRVIATWLSGGDP